MSLVNYSSSSGDETDGEELPQIKKPKIQTTQMQQEQQQNTNIKCLLPKAFNKLGADEKVSKIDEYDPSEHGGRVRSFKHERGNWATYVYIPVDVNIVEDLQEALCETPIKDSVQLHPSEELHISLSRTIVLQYHLIDSFSKSLENALDVFSRYTHMYHRNNFINLGAQFLVLWAGETEFMVALYIGTSIGKISYL